MSEAAAAAPAQGTAPAGSMLDALAAQEVQGGTPPAANQNAQPTGAPPSQQQARPSWRDTLPEDIRADPGLEKFDKLDDADRMATIARSYVNAQRMIGADKLPKPKGPDDKEALEQIYTALGRPANSNEYKVVRPTALPEGVSIDEEGENFLKQFAHQNGWNQQQFDNAYKTFYERQVRQVQEQGRLRAASYEDCQRALQATGNAPEIMNQAAATVRNYGDPQVIAKLKQAGLDNDPVMVQFFARVGKDLIGHQVLKGRGGETMQSAENYDQQIAKLRQEQAAALYDPAHPNHATVTGQLSSLYEARAKARGAA